MKQLCTNRAIWTRAATYVLQDKDYMSIQGLIGRVSRGQDLSMDEMATAVDAIMSGDCSQTEIALLLTALRAKGETVEEVAGAAAAMRRHMTVIRSDRENLLDTCGTGGDASGTFNISTAAAFVTAAAGVPVAKHGNRAVSSKTGSADVLAELGVNIEADVATVERCLDILGICFCFAPLMHQSMKHVAAVRKELGVPTIFNLLGPLCNPARAPLQLLGVGKKPLQPLLSQALAKLGTRRALVVRGEDGLDEVSLSATTQVVEIVGDPAAKPNPNSDDAQVAGTQVAGTPASGSQVSSKQYTWNPEDFGLCRADTESMQVQNAAESAAKIREIFEKRPGPPRDIVVLNAAAALWLDRQETSPAECAQLAAEAIDSGATLDLVQRLAQVSHRRD